MIYENNNDIFYPEEALIEKHIGFASFRGGAKGRGSPTGGLGGGGNKGNSDGGTRGTGGAPGMGGGLGRGQGEPKTAPKAPTNNVLSSLIGTGLGLVLGKALGPFGTLLGKYIGSKIGTGTGSGNPLSNLFSGLGPNTQIGPPDFNAGPNYGGSGGPGDRPRRPTAQPLTTPPIAKPGGDANPDPLNMTGLEMPNMGWPDLLSDSAMSGEFDIFSGPHMQPRVPVDVTREFGGLGTVPQRQPTQPVLQPQPRNLPLVGDPGTFPMSPPIQEPVTVLPDFVPNLAPPGHVPRQLPSLDDAVLAPDIDYRPPSHLARPDLKMVGNIIPYKKQPVTPLPRPIFPMPQKQYMPGDPLLGIFSM